MVLGANGAGKSTLLGLIAGLKRPWSGSRKMQAPGVGALRYVGHELMLYGQLSVHENLKLFGGLMQVPGDLIEGSLERWGLSRFRDERIAALSRGQRARVSLARAFVGEPTIVVLDEPSASLDDASTELLCEEIEAQVSRGSSVIIATHDVARLKEVVYRAVLLRDGRIMADGDKGDESAKAFEQVLTQYQNSNR